MKMRVHNEKEADALIKEYIEAGSIGEYDDSSWYTHSGEFLFKLKVLDDITGKVKKVKESMNLTKKLLGILEQDEMPAAANNPLSPAAPAEFECPCGSCSAEECQCEPGCENCDCKDSSIAEDNQAKARKLAKQFIASDVADDLFETIASSCGDFLSDNDIQSPEVHMAFTGEITSLVGNALQDELSIRQAIENALDDAGDMEESSEEDDEKVMASFRAQLKAIKSSLSKSAILLKDMDAFMSHHEIQDVGTADRKEIDGVKDLLDQIALFSNVL